MLKMKFVLLVTLTTYYCLGNINQNEGRNLRNNVRHGRSRSHLLRNHVDEVVQKDFLSTTEPTLQSTAASKSKTAPPITNAESKKNKKLMNAPTSTSRTQPNIKKKGTNRRITMDAANPSGNPNNAGQNVDKSVMYMGERALDRLGKKTDALGNKKKVSKTQTKNLKPEETESQDTLLEDKIDDAQDYVHTEDVDIVTRFLRIVESQHLLGENCTAGTDLNLGEGVVDRYAQERFKVEANVAVNRANMLTRLWKYAEEGAISEHFLYASVYSMVEFDEDIFAAGNCYDEYQFKDYWLYCPYAYRLPEGQIKIKDLAVEYKYLSNTSEWFYIARKNAERIITDHMTAQESKTNKSADAEEITDDILVVRYEDGKWSKPYYDCGGGNIWMLTYTVPFFGYKDKMYFFKGTSGIDIDLQRVDIDQCPLPKESNQLNIFAASDKCKKETTECVPVLGLGFRRGSYKCVCRKGFYFPNVNAIHRYYNGTLIEEEYEKLITGEKSQYGVAGVYECLPCAEGCESCVDDRPCVVSLNWVMRTAILILSCVIICCLPMVFIFTWKYNEVKIVRAASPVLLRVIILGAFFIYCTIIVMYPRPSVYTCTARIWLREIGFALTYGALMLKTWRVSLIFRVRSAKTIKITDTNLLKRLGLIVATFGVFLIIRTLVAPPVVIVGRTTEDLKAYLCRTDWWDHSFSILEVLFLAWGVRLCIKVRKAPSEFNECKFISMAIYNEFLLSIFLNISMLFLQKPANPDLLYIIFFCHTQLTATLLLGLIFGSKAYMVFKGHGRNEECTGMTTKAHGSKFIAKTRSRSANTQFGTNSMGGMEYSKLTEQDVQQEFLRVYTQLEMLREKNMRIGNRHLASKISAMQDAASRHDNQRAEVSARNVNRINSMVCMVTERLVASIDLPDEIPEPEPVLHYRSKGKRHSVSFAQSTDIFDGEKLPTKSISYIQEHSGATSSTEEPVEIEDEEDLSESPVFSHNGRLLKSGHAKTHAIVINLDDKSRFTDEVRV